MSFTGFDGGRAKKLSDYNIHVDSLNYGVVENLHHACMNIISQFIRNNIQIYLKSKIQILIIVLMTKKDKYNFYFHSYL